MTNLKSIATRIEEFNFPKGRKIARKYEIISKLGEGWEGEVYLMRELTTGIDRAAKFFFPHRNPRNTTVMRHAKKLHKLRHSKVLIQYHTHETVIFKGITVSCLISEFVEGELLTEMIGRYPGKRLPSFLALHLLYALACGVEEIHRAGEYHGDIHTDNIFVQQQGLGFNIKLIDFYHRRLPRQESIFFDVQMLIRVFYDVLGGAKHYAKQSKEIKGICCGLKRSLIEKKFRTASDLRRYLENMSWQTPKRK